MALITVAALTALEGIAYAYNVHRSPAAISMAVVRAKLNDPESAVFRNHVRAKRGGEGVWCGELNARNRMGGMVGFTRYVVNVEPDRSMDFLDEVNFDEGNDTFAGKWRLMREPLALTICSGTCKAIQAADNNNGGDTNEGCTHRRSRSTCVRMDWGYGNQH